LEPDAPPTPEEAPEGQPDEAGEEEEAAESEEPSEAEPPSGEPPPESDEPQGLTPEQLEKRDKAVEKAFALYTKKVTELYEEDAVNLLAAPISPSAPTGFIHKADAGRVPKELQGAVLDFFGMPVEADYELDPTKPACDTCKGLGKIKTGSRVPQYETLICGVCAGKGFTEYGVPTANGQQEPTPELVAAAVADDPAAKPDVDPWGHPRWLQDGRPNPNYYTMGPGVDPAYP